jgi:serine/threonine protein kinase
MELSTKTEYLNHIVKEIQMLSKLEHLNIIKYYNAILFNNIIDVYLEYCSGGSISSILETKQLNEDEIRDYTEQTLNGLNYLHNMNIVHRDIKGANILLNDEGIIKLSDFGSAKQILGNSEYHSLQGTPNWLAPEVMKNGEYSIFSDIWSLGCVMIEMATGKYFFIKVNLLGQNVQTNLWFFKN